MTAVIRISKQWPALALVALTSCGWCAGAQPKASAPKFRFAPAEGVITIRETTTTQSIASPGRRSSVRTTTSREKQICARSGKGYLVQATTLDAHTSGGAPGLDPVVAATKGKTVTVHVRGDGTVASVSGLDTLVAALRRQLPADFLASDEGKAFTAEAMLKRMKSEWERDTTRYVGRPARIGEVWVTAEEEQFPGGRTQRYYMARKVAGLVEAQGRQCLRVTTVSDSDPEHLRSFLGASAKAALVGLKPFSGDTKISGDSDRVLDPSTLDDFGGKSTLRIDTTMEVPGAAPFPVTLTMAKETKVTLQPRAK